MKLNPDYVRDILLYIEKNVDYNTETIQPKHNELWFGKIYKDEYFKNHEKQQLTEALNTMIEEEFIECAEPPRFIRKNLISANITGLSYTGHNLLNNIRNDTVWNAVKQKAKKIGGISLSTLVSSASAVTTSLMSDPNAVQNLLNGIDNIKGMF